jgi:hypothetical protein
VGGPGRVVVVRHASPDQRALDGPVREAVVAGGCPRLFRLLLSANQCQNLKVKYLITGTVTKSNFDRASEGKKPNLICKLNNAEAFYLLIV